MAAFDHFEHTVVLGKDLIRLPKCRTTCQAPLPVRISIRHIVELIRPLTEPFPFRSRAISANLQVKTSKNIVFRFLPNLFVSVLSNLLTLVTQFTGSQDAMT